ncbi:MAG: hypothetical protein HY536_01045 [Candidatus Colwellbacteria bacterium]|nr:hypothetical protein [Candidatus Colwellbacteria bacterium]
MSGNTTVVLRKDKNAPAQQPAEREQMLRQLLLCGTIREAREYAEDHGALAVLARIALREGTAFAELARTALRYPAIAAELRDMVQSAYSDVCAASRMNALFFKFASKEYDFGTQRLIVETLRAWTKEPRGSREEFAAEDFFRVLAERDLAASLHAEERRRARAQWRPRSLDEEICTRLYHPDLGVPDFIDWMGDQPHGDYELIMDLLREGAREGHGCAARARDILRHLEP